MRPLRCGFHAPSHPLIRITPSLCRSGFHHTIKKPQARSYSKALDGLSKSLDEAINSTCQGIEFFHSFGLPWYTLLPVTAVALRVFFLGPFFNIPARKAQQKYLDIQPLIQQRNEYFKRTLPPVTQRSGKMERSAATINLENKRYRRTLMAAFQCGPLLRYRSLFQLPIFLTMSEAIRRLTGAHTSFLGILINNLKFKPTSESLDAASLPLSQPTWVDPSMKVEGILWFTDLAAADPYSVLPLSVSAITMFHVWRSSRTSNQATFTTSVLRRLLLIISAAIFPLTINMPSGIMYYWFFSTLSTAAFSAILDKTMPLKLPHLSIMTVKRRR